MRAQIMRQVRERRTLSAVLGSGTHSNERHVHQFQLASLELECARRGREKQAALARIKAIDDRLAEVDRLIRKHQEALGLRRAGEPDGVSPQAPASAGSPTEQRRVLRYGRR